MSCNNVIVTDLVTMEDQAIISAAVCYSNVIFYLCFQILSTQPDQCFGSWYVQLHAQPHIHVSNHLLLLHVVAC